MLVQWVCKDFPILQVIFVLYVLICIPLLLYAAINPNSTYVYEEIATAPLTRLVPMSTRAWILIFVLLLLLMLAFFLYSALLFWYEYQFIAEVDRFIKSIRKSSSHASKDGMEQNGGGAGGAGGMCGGQGRLGSDANRLQVL